MAPRVFVLSPANLSGSRARRLMRRDASNLLARALRSEGGAPIGEVFRSISGLYFRGKLEYAKRFARPPRGAEGVLVIAPGVGLVGAATAIDLTALRAMARVRVAGGNERYAAALRGASEGLADTLGPAGEAVFLGSIASTKYAPILRASLGDRLRVSTRLVGMGMMQRGSLLRRRAAEGRELSYGPCPPDVRGARRHDPATAPGS